MKAIFIVGPEGSGTYMLAEAFVSSGCTYCDKDDVSEFLAYSKPENLVLRRSLPHAGEWPNILEISKILRDNGYNFFLAPIIRDQVSASQSIRTRNHADVWETADNYHRAMFVLAEIMKMHETMSLIIYEYFVASRNYRRDIFDFFGLPEPKMEFYDGNSKYYP